MYDYALVYVSLSLCSSRYFPDIDIVVLQNSHVVFTIPWAVALSIILSPLLTRRDVYKICFLQLIAVSYTIPWYA